MVGDTFLTAAWKLLAPAATNQTSLWELQLNARLLAGTNMTDTQHEGY